MRRRGVLQAAALSQIGVCPTGKLYIVDLDSKTDQGESVYEFIASKPALAKIPRHRTRGGCHLVFFCEDVPPIRRPRSNKPYDKALFSPVSDKVGAEFYHNDHQNVIFPRRRTLSACSNTNGRSWARSRPSPGNGSSTFSGSSFRGEGGEERPGDSLVELFPRGFQIPGFR